MSKQNIEPTLNDFIDARIQLAMASMFCVGIGTIQSFDSDKQMANVTMNYKRVLKGAQMAANNIDTVDVVKEYQILTRCPVVFLGGGVSRLTFPVTVGDPCLIFFADRDMDTWLETGITSNPPNSPRLHSISDAIALVGIRSNANPLTGFDTTKASLIDLHGERLAQSGDWKACSRTTNHSGWLIMKGDSIGKSSSGATYQGEMYRELFDLQKSFYPNTGSENFDSGDKVYIPDMRGRVPVGADNMGGSQKNVLTTTFTPNRNVLGGLIGEEGHQLTIAEMPSHNHSVTAGGYGGASLLQSSDGANPSTFYTNYAGGDQAHNNIQPGLICYWFIKI